MSLPMSYTSINIATNGQHQQQYHYQCSIPTSISLPTANTNINIIRNNTINSKWPIPALISLSLSIPTNIAFSINTDKYRYQYSIHTLISLSSFNTYINIAIIVNTNKYITTHIQHQH